MKCIKYLKNYCLITSLFYFIISCGNDGERLLYFNKIKNDQELQSSVLFSLKNDSISTVQYNILEGFYNNQKEKFKYKTFENLLENLNNLSNKEKQLLYFTGNYNFNKKIRKIENLSFHEKAKKLNLESNSKTGYFISSSKYSKEELFSILYIFYNSQNYILFDDDIGQYLILDNLK